MHFEEKPEIARMASAYSLDAVEHATQAMQVTLDWGDGSIARVESLLDLLYKERPIPRWGSPATWIASVLGRRSGKAKTSESAENFTSLDKMYGSYIGEVFRRNHGGIWGMVTFQGQQVIGMQASAQGTLFWPWIRVHNRLTNGSEDNVWHYYQSLLNKQREEAEA